MNQLAQSTQYFRAGVTAQDSTGVENPTGDVVQFAFLPHGTTPTSGTTWTTGSWESTSVGPPYVARVLVGPAGAVSTLVQGTTYDVFLKVTDSPEAPVLAVGTLTMV